MQALLPLVILLPLFGSALIGLFGFLSPAFRKNESLIGGLATLFVVIPFGIVLAAFLGYQSGQPLDFSILSWMATQNLELEFSYRLDELSLLMGLIVTGVGALIHLYSIGYMHGDPGYYKFFTYLNLFIFAMNNLVMGDNLMVTFLGWEGVGVCSYFLIGFWFQDMEKAKAAQKAFVANRIGDFAFLVGAFLCFKYAGSLHYEPILAAAEANQIPLEIGFWITFLFFIAATGKSAQIPLYVWLPDAMAGPTPVSALIHAATMVTSGIYLIARMSALYVGQETTLMIVALIGAFTAIVAALIAIAQNDIKKVLAYSTVSQLGYMFMALGAGAFSAAIFHVMTHAFFKACLFLGSGSVIHAMEHTHAVKDPQDVRTMGGLGKYMPSTSRTFWISTIAIAGIPPLAGFFSKDEILAKTFFSAFGGPEISLYYFVWAIGVITALLTAFYMTRVTYLTFNGKERFEAKDHPPHESPAVMTLPLWVLAILAIVGGFAGLPEIIGHGKFNWIGQHWLAGEGGPVVNRDLGTLNLGVEIFLIVLSIAIALAGVLLGMRLYKQHDLAGDDKVKGFFKGLYPVLQGKFYVDEFYNSAFIRPFVGLSRSGVAWFDRVVVDGVVNGFGQVTRQAGGYLRTWQTGVTQNYAVVMVVGLLLMFFYLLTA